MSRSEWQEFKKDLRAQLHEVPKGSVETIISEIVNECGRYLNDPKYVMFIKVGDLLSYWRRAGKLAINLRRHLNSRRTYLGSHWSPDDAVDLQVVLEKLDAAVSTGEQLFGPQKGRPIADFRRYVLENNVGRVLQLHGVKTDTAKHGTLVRVLEQVHVAVRIQGDAHRSARRVHDALKGTQKAKP